MRTIPTSGKLPLNYFTKKLIFIFISIMKGIVNGRSHLRDNSGVFYFIMIQSICALRISGVWRNLNKNNKLSSLYFRLVTIRKSKKYLWIHLEIDNIDIFKSQRNYFYKKLFKLLVLINLSRAKWLLMKNTNCWKSGNKTDCQLLIHWKLIDDPI